MTMTLRDFSHSKRIVIKLGTNVLTTAEGVDTAFLQVVARQVSDLVKAGKQVILVTSGAIGMGAKSLGFTRKAAEVEMRQALAAIGQGILMHEYHRTFAKYKQPVAQVLLTNRIMSQRKNYLNLKNAMEKLLSLNVVPIINENDCVSIDEIDLAFGDNDRLSALVASKIDADLLVILTDVAGLYDRNPREDKNASLISVVHEITDDIVAMAGSAGSAFSTGGMLSKIKAIQIAADSGCRVILADGREKNVISRVMAGDELGTLFMPRRRLSNRKRWLLNSSSEGHLHIDQGAAQAVMNHRSLLMIGVTAVEGAFKAGAVVTIGSVAKGVVHFSSKELEQLLSAKARSREDVKRGKAVVHANDMVLLTP